MKQELKLDADISVMFLEDRDSMTVGCVMHESEERPSWPKSLRPQPKTMGLINSKDL